MYLDLAVLAITIEAEDDIAKHLGDVHGDIQGADDPAVAVRQAVLDVVERGVDEDPAVVPSCGLHPNRLVNCKSTQNMHSLVKNSVDFTSPLV